MSSPRSETATQILDVAEALTQTRGFNGFSYADISEAVGVTKASLHYHFRTKGELGRQLIERYSVNFRAALDTIELDYASANDRLAQYVRLYTGVLRGDRMCLCGMLAAEVTTLPDAMGDEIRLFFQLNEAWLERVFQAGRERGDLTFSGAALEPARLLLGTLQGSMLVARSFGDAARFEDAARRLLASFAA